MAQEQHIKTEDARAGSTPGVVRYVLGISLALAIIVLTIIFLSGVEPRSNADNGGTASPGGTQSAPAR